jgi:hypothetical protein
MPFNKPPSGDLVSRYRRGEHILAFVDLSPPLLSLGWFSAP